MQLIKREDISSNLHIPCFFLTRLGKLMNNCAHILQVLTLLNFRSDCDKHTCKYLQNGSSDLLFYTYTNIYEIELSFDIFLL